MTSKTSGADCLRLVQPDARCCVLRFLADENFKGAIMIEDVLFLAAETTQEEWTGVVFHLSF